jgi:stringent starvation protein B
LHQLQMGNELVEFSARFGGVARQISVPVTNVYALYARETGHGMTFDVEGSKPSIQAKGETESVSANTRPPAALPAPSIPEPPKKPSGGGKPTLRRIK